MSANIYDLAKSGMFPVGECGEDELRTGAERPRQLAGHDSVEEFVRFIENVRTLMIKHFQIPKERFGDNRVL